MSGCTVTSIEFDKLQQLIVENQRLKEKVSRLTEERQKLINENVNLKLALKKKDPGTKAIFIELISEHKGVIDGG